MNPLLGKLFNERRITMDNGIICIIQARMGSERLPGKVIKEIKGTPMILHILNRANKIEKTIVATSTNSENDRLEDVVKAAGGNIFRGSEDDVLKRYVDAAEQFRGKYIIRVTGDCPLISAEVIDELIDKFLEAKVDYMRVDVPNTFSRGFDAEIFTREALMKAHYKATEARYREHVTLYMYEHPEEFSVERMEAKESWNRPNYRLCVDTKEDFDLVEKVYEALYDQNKGFEIDEIISYLDNHPEVAGINQFIIQKNV